MYNHSAYEVFLRDADQPNIALLIVNVDQYDELRQAYGAETVDRITGNVAHALRRTFRSVDSICRISNDEFVVIMSRMNSDMRGLIFEKVERINHILTKESDGLPTVSVSVGAAFGDRKNPYGNIFQDADSALSRSKEMKRGGCTVY